MSAQQRPPRTRAGGDSRGLCESILRKAKPAREAHRILWLVTHGAAAIVVFQARGVCLLSLLGRCLLHRCRAPSRVYVEVAWRILVNFDQIIFSAFLYQFQSPYGVPLVEPQCSEPRAQQPRGSPWLVRGGVRCKAPLDTENVRLEMCLSLSAPFQWTMCGLWAQACTLNPKPANPLRAHVCTPRAA